MRNNDEKRYQYIESLFVDEAKDLLDIGKDLPENIRHMQISPVEGKMLYTLVKMANASKIVEIGSLIGFSSIWLAKAVKGQENAIVHTIEKNPKMAIQAAENHKKCNVDSLITIHQGEALDLLPTLEKEGPFDIAFIDADKINYSNYLDWAEKNIRKGGLIIGDNTFLFGAMYNDADRKISETTLKAMQDFNKRLANSSKYTSILLPTIEGMIIAIKNF